MPAGDRLLERVDVLWKIWTRIDHRDLVGA
jgi:hypothetical protein